MLGHTAWLLSSSYSAYVSEFFGSSSLLLVCLRIRRDLDMTILDSGQTVFVPTIPTDTCHIVLYT